MHAFMYYNKGKGGKSSIQLSKTFKNKLNLDLRHLYYLLSLFVCKLFKTLLIFFIHCSYFLFLFLICFISFFFVSVFISVSV